MSLFPVDQSNLCIFSTAIGMTVFARNGVFLRPNNVTQATVAGVHSNYGVGGLSFDADGSVRIVDSQAGLPAGTQYQNGLPMTPDGRLCVDGSGAAQAVAYNHGMPYTANGSIAGLIA